MSTNSIRKTTAHPPATRLTLLFLGLFIVLFVLFIYTFWHEAGHALTGLAFGQTLQAFNLNFWGFSAHVRLAGKLTPVQNAVQSAAGLGLPLLLWNLFIVLVPRRTTLLLEFVKLIGSMAVVNTLLPWIIIPLLALFGQAPPADDVTHFLQASQIAPLWLAFIAALLYGLGWLLFLTKFAGIRDQLLQLKQGTAVATNGMWPTVIVMAGMMTVCLSVTLVVNGTMAQKPQQLPPPNFQPLLNIDLATDSFAEETVGQIVLAETAVVGILFTIQNVDTSYFDLSLVDSEGNRSVILHGEDFRTNQEGSGSWEKALAPGAYQLVLTTEQNPGVLSVYWGYP